MAGTDKNRPLLSEGPVIILVEPQLPENIGMVARAMANFGLFELRLVKPREPFPSDKAYAAASKADHIIDNTVLYDTVSEAIADLKLVYATTARIRDSFKPVCSPVEAAAKLRRFEQSGKHCGVMFGRERFGLSNEEVSLADEIVTFPVNPAFASLNIAQAVLLVSYEWMKSGLEHDYQTAFEGPVHELADKQALHGLFEHLEEALQVRGYFRPPERTQVMQGNLRSVLARAGFSNAEIKLLRGVISSLDRFSPNRPRGAGAPENSLRQPKNTSPSQPHSLANEEHDND